MSPETPPEERRKDINSRKVIEVVTKHMDEKLKRVVTWEKLSAFGFVIVGAAWSVTTLAVSGAKADVSQAVIQSKADVTQIRKDSGEAIQLVREELKETRADIRGLYRSVRSNAPSPRLSAPVPELPPNPLAVTKKEPPTETPKE